MCTDWSLAHLLHWKGVPSSCSDAIRQEKWQLVQIFFILFHCLRRLFSPLQNGTLSLMFGKKKLIQTIQVLQTEKKRHLCYVFPTSSESLPDPGMSLTLLLGKRERLIACHDWGWNKCRMSAVFLPEKIHQRRQKNPSWSRCVLCRAVICKIIIELMALKGWTRPKSSCICFCNLMLTTSLILWNLADWCHAKTKFFRGALSSSRMSFVTWYSSWPVSPLLFFQCSHKAP